MALGAPAFVSKPAAGKPRSAPRPRAKNIPVTRRQFPISPLLLLLVVLVLLVLVLLPALPALLPSQSLLLRPASVPTPTVAWPGIERPTIGTVFGETVFVSIWHVERPVVIFQQRLCPKQV